MANQVLKERYLIQKELGRNAGRRTVLAQDLETQEPVVIKLLIFGEDFQWDNLKLFEREAQTLQMLSHPAIPRYLDYFDINTSRGQGFALVQSYIPAQSLETCLKSGRTFSEEELKELAKALLDILLYLHGQQPQVVHRDIKPSNILLGDRSGNSAGQIYLVDFGSVQTLAAKKGSTITVVGTYGYMPPEQFGGRTVPASDLYSLGATLIYLATGRHPAELSQDNLQIQFESAANLSVELINWLKWMTEPSLNRRLISAGEALKALEKPSLNTRISAIEQKPLGSRIKLKRNGEAVEFFIPPKKFSSRGGVYLSIGIFASIIALSPILVEVTYFMEDGYFSSDSLFESVLALLICVGFALYLGWILIQEGYFICTRLELNPKQILLTREILGMKFQRKPILKKDIKKLTSKLSISHLTPPEIDWLANELSEWSGVAINFSKRTQ